VTLAAIAAVFVAAVVQSGTGFGFALVAVPALAAIYDPVTAVAVATVLSLLMNLLTLVGERRESEVLWPVVRLLVLVGVPGMVLGAIVLTRAPEDALHLLVAASVLVAVAVRLVRGGGHDTDRRPPSGIFAGVVAGAMTTSTGINGPPVVLHLLHRGATPAQSRDTLAAYFVATAAFGVVVLAVAGALDLPGALPWMLLAAAAGQVAGRPLFARIGDSFEPVALALLVASAVVAAAPAII
jgi:uncharacterized membrane protein YfcA